MSPPPICCPFCSADLNPVGADALCAHCRKPLPRELLGEWTPPAAPVSATKEFSSARHYGKLFFVTMFITALSLTKGLGVVFSLPFLFLSLPLLLAGQILAGIRISRRTVPPSVRRLTDIQLAAAVLPFLLLPIMGDGYEILFFVMTVQSSSPAAERIMQLSAASMLAYLAATIKLFIALRITKPQKLA